MYVKKVLIIYIFYFYAFFKKFKTKTAKNVTYASIKRDVSNIRIFFIKLHIRETKIFFDYTCIEILNDKKLKIY